MPVPFLRQQIEHLTPDLGAALVAVPLGVADDLGVGSQLVRAVGAGIENDPRRPPHDLPHQRHVRLDPLDRRLDQDRIVNWRDQLDPVPRRQDAGDPQNSAPVDCTGQLRIERSLSSSTPVRHVQPIAVRINPVCIAC